MIISYLHEIRSDAEEIMAKSSWYTPEISPRACSSTFPCTRWHPVP